MSLFEEASIIITPNGFKAGKLYAVKGADLDVTRATGANRINPSGANETMGANVPRIDYTGGGCPSILVEPQSTNLTLYSEQINNSYWQKTGGSVTTNSTISPDGTQNADLFTENTANVDHAFFDVVSYFVAGTTYTISFYAKANGRTKVELVSANSGTCPNGRFDLVAQTATAINGSFNAQIESVGNGWFRCSVSRVAPNTGLDVPYYAMVQIFGTISYVGDGTSGMYFWGMQSEVGSYATSYIPTTSASVTRNADVISKTGISDLIGQTEGALLFDFKYTQLDENGLIPIIIIQNASNHTYFYIDANESISFDFIYGGGDVVSISTASGFAVKGQRYKIALAYKQDDFVVYINGVQIGTDNSGLIPSFSELYFGYPYASGYSYPSSINAIALWKTRLSNEKLAELTTI